MPATLELLRTRTRSRFGTVRRHIDELPIGRGGEWKALLAHVLSEFERDFQITEDQLARAESYPAPAAHRVRLNAALHLERTQALLDALHFKAATYRSAIARSDVPVGLQHLIDVLMEEIVIEKGDPIIHLDPRNMYSTTDLAGPLNRLVAALEPPHTLYSGPHPIAFHLPALDPNNVLLSPVLAHEVAHTAVNRQLRSELQTRLPTTRAGTDIQAEFAVLAEGMNPEAQMELQKTFLSWSSELICDAVAVTLAGPSFLFAFTTFAVPTISNAAGPKHPGTHDRIRYALELVDHLGWTDFMKLRVPNLMAWLSTIAASPVLSGTAEERFLRRAIDQTADLRREIALSHIPDHFVPNGQESRIDQATEWLKQGVPLIDIDGEALTPWEAILAGWLAGIKAHGDQSSAIALTAGDHDYNAVIVKALEYSQIVSAWRKP